MAKKIIREIIIMLLLCLAVILLLGVVLYAYVPGNKTMPEKVSYTIPTDVKKELEEASLTENSQVILTYEIDSTDLTNYQRINDYNPGKPNPFSSYKKETVENSEESTNNGSTTSSGTNTQTSNNTNSTTTQANTTTTKGSTTTNSSADSADTDGSPYTHDKGTK